MPKIPQLTSCCCVCSLKTGSIWIAVWSIIISSITLYGANMEWKHVNQEDYSNEGREREIVYLHMMLMILSLVSAVRITLSFALLFGIFFHMPILVLYWIVFSYVHMGYGVVLSAIGVILEHGLSWFNLIYYPLYAYACLVVYSFYRLNKSNSINISA